MKASTNEECKTFIDARPITNNSPCHLNNFLHSFKDAGGLWLLNSVTQSQAYCIWNEEHNDTHPFTISYYNKDKSSHEVSKVLLKIEPVLFLNGNITLTGKGTENMPYKISKIH